MVDRWDCQRVVCIKEYKTLKIGSHYDIKGRGNLECNADKEVDGRSVYGFCIEDGLYGIILLKRKCQNILLQNQKIINHIKEI